MQSDTTGSHRSENIFRPRSARQTKPRRANVVSAFDWDIRSTPDIDFPLSLFWVIISPITRVCCWIEFFALLSPTLIVCHLLRRQMKCRNEVERYADVYHALKPIPGELMKESSMTHKRRTRKSKQTGRRASIEPLTSKQLLKSLARATIYSARGFDYPANKSENWPLT